MSAPVKIGARAKAALAVLNAGGYWRKALETKRYPVRREQFEYRLHDAGGNVVAGAGIKTFLDLEKIEVINPGLPGVLSPRHVTRSSVWASEWVLRYYPLDAGKPAGA